MSIPKEPRQLMINLMYLVLTAILALNVSAEIINAFFALNKGIKTSNLILDQSNDQIKKQIDKQADAYKNPINEGFRAASVETQQIDKEFVAYINSLNELLTKEAGGVSKDYSDGRPERFKDKDVTTRIFVNEKKGDELQKRILETRDKFLAVIKDPADRELLSRQIALKVDSIAPDSKAKTWPEYKFKQMPVAAVMPFFSKLQADAKTSETAILNYLFNKIGGSDIKFDNFKVAIAPKTGYVIQGEKFEADVYLAAYSSNPGTGVSINVNGSGLPIKEGVAHYEATGSDLGKKTVKATATIKNPLTGEVKSVTGEFEYEVGRRSVAVSADKMNVFYIGVDNPISVSAAGVSSNQITVTGSGVDIKPNGPGHYIVTATRPNDKASITVSGGGLNQSFPYRVKKIPDPVPKLSNSRGGTMGTGEFKAQGGVSAVLENFDFDAKCSIQSYVLVRVPKREDAVPANNTGSRYEEKAARLVQMAKPTDIYYYNDIKARCPGDVAGRDVGSMVFTIK